MRAWVAVVFLAAATDAAQARTWRVEKDGSGDFTVIQDALDAAASGDSVLVGPGRYEEYRPGASTVSGAPFQAIAWLTTNDVTILGSGAASSVIGPSSLVAEIGGVVTAGFYIDGGSMAHVEGFSVENSHYLVVLRRRANLVACRLTHTSSEFGTRLVSGDQIEIRDCEFLGANSLTTSSPDVMRPQIINCSFEDAGFNGFAIAIGNGASDAWISHCTITGYAAGIQTSLGGTATIEDTTFDQVRIGAIDLSSGAITMRRCRVEAGMRFSLVAGQGRLEVYDSIIGGGTLTTIATWTSIFMRNCHLLNGGGLTVDSRGPAYDISDLRYNWWGTTDLELIASWITEFNPNVIYEPILTKSVPTARESLSSLKARFAQPAVRHEP